MKKAFALLLLLVMLLTLSACRPKQKTYKLQPIIVPTYFDITCEAENFETGSDYHNYRRLLTGNFTLKTTITPKEGVQTSNVRIKLKVGFGDDTLHGYFGYQWKFITGNMPGGYDEERYDYKYTPYLGNADDYTIKNFKEIEISIPDGTDSGGVSYDAVELFAPTDEPISYYTATDPTEDNLIIYVAEASGYIIAD